MTYDEDRWAILRQTVIGAADLATTSKELRDAFGLSDGFADPILEDVGLADETIRVGSQTHLEIVAPLHDRTSIAQWIAKGGGGGGYALSIQVPDIAPLLANATALGVRTVADQEVYGHRIVQLHPKDMGLLVELDEIADPGVWFWDDITTETPADPVIDDVVAVEVASADPSAQAARWAEVFGTEVGDAGGVPSIRLGERTVRFVAGERPMLVGIDVRLTPAHADAAGEVTISGVRFRLLAA
ncbi:hypothetical protein CLV56_1558 [Mumia flava]|uniref:Glyoxalase-like protein n=1 Tax=Mumia flava TaxID=1348852 RepID=A0A2M9BHA9_9ACTN|nr:hypothetical protein [Mumia flava]PJJ57331.1 hypothetical protein CLV56_1558 [Mumia flava]